MTNTKYLTVKERQFLTQADGKPWKADYTPTPTGEKFHKCKCRYKLLVGAGGTGKTTACIWECVRRVVNATPCKDGWNRASILVIRSGVKNLKHTVVENLKEVFPEYMVREVGSTNPAEVQLLMHEFEVNVVDKQTGEQRTVVRKVDITFVCMSVCKSTAEQDLKGRNVTIAWLNEATEIPIEVFREVTNRVGRFPTLSMIPDGMSLQEYHHDLAGVIMDTNPSYKDNWVYKDYIMKDCVNNPEYYAYFHTKGWCTDNPDNKAGILHEHLRASHMAETADPDRRTQMYVGEWVEPKPAGHLVYGQDFEERKHVREIEPEKFIPIVIGYDPGLTGACVFVQNTMSGIKVLGEICTPENSSMTNVDFLQSVRNHYDYHYASYYDGVVMMYCDPISKNREANTGTTTIQYIRRAGFEPRLATTNIPADRIEQVRETLRDGHILIDPKCETIIKGMKHGYRTIKSNSYEDRYKILKNHYSHVQDALQYVILAIKYGADPLNWQIRNNKDSYLNKFGFEERKNSVQTGLSYKLVY